uniref:long-chain-fatty-acid--CoA ligase n=1 Tax=Gadus morhua TaxID=8049 RepID=A0A8C5FLA6_GADMO
MEIPGVLRQLWSPELEDLRQYVRSVPTNVLMGMSAFAALSTYWYATRPRAIPARCDLAMQSVEVPGTEGARRLAHSDQLLTHFYDDALTLYELFLRGLRVSNDGPCLGSRKPNQPYEWQSYSEVVIRAEHIGSALLHKGHTPDGDKHIGIFSQNRPEWTITEMACYTYSLVAVPLYDTLGTDAIDYIIDQASISTVFCDVPDKVRLILGCVAEKQHSVKTLVVMEPVDSELVAQGLTCGIQILSLAHIEVREEERPPKPDDLALVCFTSGTTGNPKGAMLTHGNVISNTAAFLELTEVNTLTAHDVHMSFLPLAHMFERVVAGVVLINGGRIGFFQGDIRLLMDDMKMLRPTVFPVVPRLLNRMFDKIFGMAGSPLKRWLLDFASRRKMAEFKSGVVRKDSIWDKFIFKKIQSGLGGRVRLMITGAAPVSPAVLTFLRTAISCQVSPATTHTPHLFYSNTPTECLAHCPHNQRKVLPLPAIKPLGWELNTTTLVSLWDGRETPKESLQVKLYLCRAPSQRVRLRCSQNGTLKLIDRKKNLFKLAQGEYISPEKIETIYNSCGPVAQIFVHGDSLQAFLVAIVVLDPELLPGWAQQRGIEGSYKELCQNKEIKKAILEDMVMLGKEGGLKSFEQVREILLHPEMFTVQNGLLTPTLKAKRFELLRQFREQIDALYASVTM